MSETKSVFTNPKVIAIVALTILVTILLFQNAHVVSLHLFFWHVEASLVVLVLMMLAIGFVLGFVGAKLSRRKTAPDES